MVWYEWILFWQFQNRWCYDSDNEYTQDDDKDSIGIEDDSDKIKFIMIMKKNQDNDYAIDIYWYKFDV